MSASISFYGIILNNKMEYAGEYVVNMVNMVSVFNMVNMAKMVNIGKVVSTYLWDSQVWV